MKILVLYEELAWYFVNCINVLAEKTGAQVLIISKKPNSVAPFNFKFVHPLITIKIREELGEKELTKLVREFSPTAIFMVVWSSKPYLKLVK